MRERGLNSADFAKSRKGRGIDRKSFYDEEVGYHKNIIETGQVG
jgi:hypothetical protein